MKQRKPAERFIQRNLELVSLQTRVPIELKEEIDQVSEQLETSQARFVEAAVKWYIDALKKEGSL